MELGSFLNFTGLNIAALGSSLLIFFWINNYRVQSLSKLLISLFILFCSQIILIQILLGVFEVLTYTNIAIATYSLFVVLVMLLGKGVVRNLKIELVLKDRPSFLLISLIFGPILFLLFAKFFNAALQIPLEYDSVAYHLPFIAEWLQSGSLNELYYSAFAGPISYYPSNYELLDLWTFLPFGNDFFANLLNFPLFVVLGIVIWRILRNLGIDQNTAIIATAIPFYMPIFLHQAGLPLVDLFFALTFAMSIFFLQEIYNSKEEKYSDFLFFGLSMGLFIGTKYLGLVYGALVVVLLILVSLYRFKRKEIKLLKAGSIAITGVLLTGSFFYIRNWIDSGNPLFPVDITLFGMNILEGYKGAGVNEMLVNTSLIHNLDSFSAIKDKIVKFFYITGPYGLISIVLPLVIFLELIITGFYKKIIRGIPVSRSSLAVPAVLGATLLIYFYLYLKAPYTFRDFFPNIRYAMPFLILGTIVTGYVVNKLKFFKKTFYLFTVITFVLSFLFLIFDPPASISYTDRILIDYSVLVKHKGILASFIIALLAFLYACQVGCLKSKDITLRHTITALLIVASFVGTYRFFDFGYKEREVSREYAASKYFGEDQTLMDIIHASEWLNQNAPQSKIAYSGFNFHYYLYGRNFSREVDYVNINECTDCRYFDYRDSENSIRRDPAYQNWLQNLAEHEKEYLVVNPISTPGVRSYELEWAQENPENFEKVFNVNDIYIYKVSYD
ncbi:hypothetical protein CVV38_04605 [Candidatus Peregrinibacteria bacterium HGW-Peregrinibacteria-1]|jgi:hypothetical protein|nr:MAG: hypothetical protein CVV38_04605 [Candidatus Peregrinibacteria bacterium HGW-Peregrinibacteria-1]